MNLAILAQATVRERRPAAVGRIAGLAVLSAFVLLPGAVLDRVPIRVLQFVVGVLLLLFGLRWLRMAALRAAWFFALPDEEAAFANETSELQDLVDRKETRLDSGARLTAFKAVLLEGLAVVFIVVALDAETGMLASATVGVAAARIAPLLLGLIIHRPLARWPENALKCVRLAVDRRRRLDHGGTPNRMAGSRPGYRRFRRWERRDGLARGDGSRIAA
mgnify:CR=1 FL=1